MTLTTQTIISLIAIVLSISAMVTVFINSGDADVEQRLDEQQLVIMQNRGMITNNTIFLENQFNFNNDVIGWASNVTAKIDSLAQP